MGKVAILDLLSNIWELFSLYSNLFVPCLYWGYAEGDRDDPLAVKDKKMTRLCLWPSTYSPSPCMLPSRQSSSCMPLLLSWTLKMMSPMDIMLWQTIIQFWMILSRPVMPQLLWSLWHCGTSCAKVAAVEHVELMLLLLLPCVEHLAADISEGILWSMLSIIFFRITPSLITCGGSSRHKNFTLWLKFLAKGGGMMEHCCLEEF